MKKIKEFSKKYLIGFILGLISAGAVIAYAETYFPSNQTTYDNSASGMQATNVQDAIDELYGVCFPPNGSDTITDLLPDNPDELYKDEHGDIRYYGKNPNNYIYFNCSDQNNQSTSTCDLWRIIGVIDGKIKIIRNESIGGMAWASNGSNNWNNSSLKTYLNVSYYNSINATYKSMISNETYYLGGSSSSNYRTLTTSAYYDAERNGNASTGNPISTTQYIGLMYPSDYGYAAGNSCLSTALYEYSDGCMNSDYLFSGDFEWLQVPYGTTISGFATYIGEYGSVSSGNGGVKFSRQVRPSLYLNSNVQITGGDGSKSNPFQLSL